MNVDNLNNEVVVIESNHLALVLVIILTLPNQSQLYSIDQNWINPIETELRYNNMVGNLIKAMGTYGHVVP